MYLPSVRIPVHTSMKPVVPYCSLTVNETILIEGCRQFPIEKCVHRTPVDEHI